MISFFQKKYQILLMVILLLAVCLAVTYFQLRSPKYTAVQRGRMLAEHYGCFSCHGFEGSKGVNNPGYNFGEIPSWQGGTSMMYLKNDTDLREYILYGKPKRKKTAAAGLIKMPAFQNVISEKQLDDLTAYLKAVMEIIDIDDSIPSQGFAIADKNGCFGCHGPYGMGGMRNGFSLKGFTPGWEGNDFSDLVRNDDELSHWIKNGKIDRLDNNGFARFFTKRQIVKMPAYKNTLTDDQIQTVIHYIKWLRKNHRG